MTSTRKNIFVGMDRGFEERADDQLPCRHQTLCSLSAPHTKALRGDRVVKLQCTRNACSEVSLRIPNLLSLAFRTLVSHLYFSTSLESSTCRDSSEMFYCSS